MKKIYCLVFAWCCVMSCVGTATAQERIMFSVTSGAPEGLYYLNKNGGEEMHACNFLPAEALGSGTEYFIVSKDGELIGINSQDGRPETDEEVGYGTLYRLTAKGVVKVQDFDYAVASNTFLTEGWSDGKLYATAPTAFGSQVMRGTKYTGLVGTSITNYGFRPGELLTASTGGIYGVAPIGGANGQGYIYKTGGTNITIVYNFAKTTGHFPQGKLMQGSDGYLYGVTKRGGNQDYGVIYKIRSDGTGYRVLHHFDKVNGMYPDRGLVQDASGNLYGMTFSGGASNLGVVYKIRPDGTGFTNLHHFSVKQQYYSGVPQSLLLDGGGFLYGRVPQSQSMIFRIKTDGTNFKILYSKVVYLSTMQLVSSITPQYKLEDPINGATGVSTSRTFVADSVPGAVSYMLEISTTPDFTSMFAVAYTMHRRPSVHGLSPSTKYYARVSTSLWSKPGPVTSFTTAPITTSVVTTPADKSTNAPAPTLKVTVKAMTGAKRYTVQLNNRIDFAGTMFTQTSAVDDQRTLTFTGLRYNTKYYARVKTELSEVWGPITSFTTRPEIFSYVTTPVPGSSEVDRAFTNLSVLPVPGAKLYTLQISTSNIFTPSLTKTYKSIDNNQINFLIRNLNPSTQYYTKVRTDISTAYGPVKSFTTRAAKNAMRLVGSTTFGGNHGFGTIFSYSIDSLKFTKHHDLADMDMAYPDLVAGPDGFYGAQYSQTIGKVFRYNFNTGFETSATMSISREGDMMMASNGMLYLTPDYLPWSNGAIHKLPSDLGSFSRIHFFNAQTGLMPRAPLMEYGDGYLYGTTLQGGLYDRGVIYKMRGNGSDFQVVFNFNRFGFWPAGGLTDGNDGYLYGTTNSGENRWGTIFKAKPDGSAVIFLHSFQFHDGAYPTGELLIEKGIIYGIAGSGGTYDRGVLFKMNTNGTGFTILKHFDDPLGANPISGVVSDGKGMLYGFTPYGGTDSWGSVYRIRTDGTGYKTLFEFTGNDGSTGISPYTTPILMEDTFTAPEATVLNATVAKVDVYPNPSTSVFNLRFPTNGDEHGVELMDHTGNILYQGRVKGEELTLGENLPKGMYILKIRDGERSTEHMLIKK